MVDRNTLNGVALPVPEGWEGAVESFSDYMHAAAYTPESIRTRLQRLRTFARAMGKTPEGVSAVDIIEWVAQKNWSAETRHGYYVTIKGFYAYLCELGVVDADPSRILPSIHRNVPPPRPIPEGVLRDVLDRVDGRERLMIELAAFAGLRCIEISRVHRDDIVSVPGVEYALIVHGKGDKTRIVPLPESLYEAIKEHASRSTEGWLFPSKYGGHLSAHHVSKLGNKHIPSPYTMHTLRHRYATITYLYERDILAVRNLLGHASVETTQRYAQAPSQAMVGAATFAATVHVP